MLSMNKRRIIFSVISVLMLLIIPIFAYSQENASGTRKLIVFDSPTCHRCLEVKNELMPRIEKEFKDRIKIEYRDITDVENQTYLLALKEKYHTDIKLVWPVIFFEGGFLNGKNITENNLRQLMLKSLNVSYREGGLPAIDLVAFFKSFKIFGIIIAGLEDGINPCAFTVIVFFISYLAVQGYRKKELIAIGLSFILAVFITYLFIGLGLFNIIYGLDKFLMVRKIFNISIGIFSIVLGGLSVYDLFKFKKTGQTDGLILQLPKAVKNQIHSVIGLHYRKPKESSGEQILRVSIFRLVLSAFITGFLVSFLELLCTGQVYLPTIALVLKTTPLKLQALGYLVLYNLMFILPLVGIFLLALWGVTSEQFAGVLKKHLSTIKILMAILFFALGIFLLWGA